MRIRSNVAVNTVELPPSADSIQSKRVTRALAKSAKALAESNQNGAKLDTEEAVINRIEKKMPKTQMKKAYIFESECIFDKFYDGTYMVSVVSETGQYIPSELSVTSNKITVKFEPLKEVATVSITVI